MNNEINQPPKFDNKDNTNLNKSYDVQNIIVKTGGFLGFLALFTYCFERITSKGVQKQIEHGKTKFDGFPNSDQSSPTFTHIEHQTFVENNNIIKPKNYGFVLMDYKPANNNNNNTFPDEIQNKQYDDKTTFYEQNQSQPSYFASKFLYQLSKIFIYLFITLIIYISFILYNFNNDIKQSKYFYNQAILNYERHNYNDSINYLDKAIDFRSSVPEYIFWGKSFYLDNKLGPELSLYYFHLGNSYYNIKKIDYAISSYTKAIEYDPKLPEAYFNLGIIYYDNVKNNYEANKMFKKVIELKSNDTQSIELYNLTFNK